MKWNELIRAYFKALSSRDKEAADLYWNLILRKNLDLNKKVSAGKKHIKPKHTIIE